MNKEQLKAIKGLKAMEEKYKMQAVKSIKVKIIEEGENGVNVYKNSRFPYRVVVNDNTIGMMYVGDCWTPMFKSGKDEEITSNELIAIGKAMNAFTESVKKRHFKKE